MHEKIYVTLRHWLFMVANNYSNTILQLPQKLATFKNLIWTRHMLKSLTRN